MPLALILGMMALSGFAAYQGVQQQNKIMDAQAKMAKNNAKVAEWEGERAQEVAQEKAKEHRRQVAQMIGKQRAAMGASGIVADEGTFADLVGDTAYQGKLDELAILHEGDMEAWRAKVSAGNYKAQAGIYKGSKQNPYLNTGLAVMGSGMQGMNYYNTFKNSGSGGGK